MQWQNSSYNPTLRLKDFTKVLNPELFQSGNLLQFRSYFKISLCILCALKNIRMFHSSLQQFQRGLPVEFIMLADRFGWEITELQF